MKKAKTNIDLKTVLRIGNVLLIVILLAGACLRYFSSSVRPVETVETVGPVETVGSVETVRPVETAEPVQNSGPVETVTPTRKDLASVYQPTYMIYYGELDEELIRQAQRYDIVIVHPKLGDITREQVEEIQSAGTCVLGYLSVGEDLRTAWMTPEQMLQDDRFTGDGTGPRVDGREPGDSSLDGGGIMGVMSPAGGGYASYYLDDNDYDGAPDFNPNFGCAYTNIGDPAWYAALEDMTLDGPDGVPGIREILTTDYGRGLGCDGLFLDAIDTCAPNSYSADSDLSRTRFEWTAPGVGTFMERLKSEYSGKYIAQNRGLFFYNYGVPHFDYRTDKYIDFLVFESYMLDSNIDVLYSSGYFLNNKNVYAPKINAEANRRDGFKVLSLGYAEGPEKYQLKETLLGETDTGLDILLKDMKESQNEVGFSHYITDRDLLLANNFVLEHREQEDTAPPIWSSVHNRALLDEPPVPRIGIGQVEPVKNGVIVRWDVAIDRSGVAYTLYYQKTPFDFETDPNLTQAQSVELIPEIGDGYSYGASQDIWPNQAEVTGLDGGETYYFVLRAKDRTASGNEEKNTVVMTGATLG